MVALLRMAGSGGGRDEDMAGDAIMMAGSAGTTVGVAEVSFFIRLASAEGLDGWAGFTGEVVEDMDMMAGSVGAMGAVGVGRYSV